MSKTELFEPDEIAIIQARQLRKTIHYCYQRSPYYRDLFDRERLLPTDVKTPKDLRHLPPTPAEDLRRQSERFLCVRMEEVADFFSISASDLTDFGFSLSNADLSRLAYAEQLSAQMAGITAHDVVALVQSLDACPGSGLAAYLGLRRLGAAVVRADSLAPEQLLRVCESHRPRVLQAAPSTLKRLADWAEARGVNLRGLSIRQLICSGELVRHRDGRLNDLGEYLSRAWKADLRAVYRPEPAASVLGECEAGSGAHVHPELLYTEILDEKGNTLPEGEIGELCVTPFGVTGMPVLRFRTGEVATWQTGQCACGRHTARIGPVLGRREDQLNLSGRTIYPHEVAGVVLGQPDVHAYLLVADKQADDNDMLTVLLDTQNPKVADRLAERFRLQLGLNLSTQVVSQREFLAIAPAGSPAALSGWLDRRDSGREQGAV